MEAQEKATWIDKNGREVVIRFMSDYWLNNIRKMFKGEDRQKIQPIIDEIKRRNKKRKIKNWQQIKTEIQKL